MKKNLIPAEAVKRLYFYLRCLMDFHNTGKEKVSSNEIADYFMLNPAQVRKDLSYFGDFGRKGVGYETAILIQEIKDILKLNKKWEVAIVGIGNIGSALSLYQGFKKYGFSITHAFDSDVKKIGQKAGNLVIEDVKDLEKTVKNNDVKIAIISTSANSAQRVAGLLVSSGIKTILNFAPVHLNVPKEIKVSYVDISAKLGGLTYYL